MQLLYIILSLSLFFQITFFVLLSIPSTSTGLKARILKSIGTSPKTRLFILVQSLFLVLAFILYLDNKRMEVKWTGEKEFLNEHKNPGTEIRKAELSYKTLLVQRNIYICMLTIIVTISLNGYMILFRRIFKKRDLLDAKKNGADSTVPTERAKIQ